MAGQLLQRRVAAEAAAEAGDAAAGQRAGRPWLDTLPAYVDLPWLVSRLARTCMSLASCGAQRSSSAGHRHGVRGQQGKPFLGPCAAGTGRAASRCPCARSVCVHQLASTATRPWPAAAVLERR